MNCIKPILILAFIVLCSAKEGKLIVKQHPSYHVYDYNSGALRLSDLKNLLLAVNGFSINQMIDWKGLKSTNSLASPKVTLLFLTDAKNVDSLDHDNTISVDEDTSLNFQYLRNYYDSSNGLVKAFKSLPAKKELENLDCSNEATFYVVKMSDSEDLNNDMDSVIEAVKNKCVKDKDDLLVYVLATENKQRVRRAADEAGDNSIVNRAVLYSDNYPVMFHIIFWTSLVLGFAIIGIVCGMFKMDPGLDTVIYRMTSQRIKKDN